MILLRLRDIPDLRRFWHSRQDRRCPIFKKRFPHSDVVLDHDHKTGYCRGTIHRGANAIEGKFQYAYRRYGGHKHMPFTTFLRSLADYLDTPKDDLYLHPRHKRKRK